MNCADFETMVIEMGRDRLMDAVTRERGLEHTRLCASCAALMAEERTLSRGLRALSAEEAAEEIPDRIEISLREAFRQRAAAPVSAHIGPARSSRRFLAIAALALLTFGVSLALWIALSTRRESPARGSTNAVIASTTKGATAPDNPNPQAPKKITELRRENAISNSKPVTRPKRVAKAKDFRQSAGDDFVSGEVVTPFFSVVAGGDLIPIESGQILRVRMSRSDLIPLGIPFNQERVNEIINADVLVTNDGLARAIRLVY